MSMKPIEMKKISSFANHTNWHFSTVMALVVWLSLLPVAVQAETIGKILTSQGVTTLQRSGAAPRITGAGDLLEAGDILSTASNSLAMIELKDGTRMTLRPGTVFTVEQFSSAVGKENAAYRLFRGGLRALTGFLSKQNPDAVKIHTNTATIGIRGTDFDARLCGRDCVEEARKRGGGQVAKQPIIARTVLANGKVNALGPDNQRRTLSAGAALYSGDVIETSAASLAVIAFADETRLTLQADTRFQVEDYRYQGGSTDRSVFRLLKGALRMVTGLIGKAEPQHVKVTTQVATIGIRGTGLDAVCGGACAGVVPSGGQSGPNGGLFLHTWSGATVLTTPLGSLPVPNGSTAFVGGTGVAPVVLPALPAFMNNNPAPRPDSVSSPPTNSFGSLAAGTSQGGQSSGQATSSVGANAPEQPSPGAAGEGLHVWVRDGLVSLEQAGQRVELGPGQAAFAATLSGQSALMAPVVLPLPPGFMRFDNVPLPASLSTQPSPGAALLNKPGSSQSSACEVR